MRTDFVNPIGGPFSQVVQAEKPIPRDTEAFKKLLQQLGCQSRQHHPGNDVYHIINHSNITNPTRFVPTCILFAIGNRLLEKFKL